MGSGVARETDSACGESSQRISGCALLTPAGAAVDALLNVGVEGFPMEQQDQLG